jgi:uncharacterized protein YjbJ (UPF0337 family)
MNWDRIQGNWRQLKGRVRVKWGELTDDAYATVEGSREISAGRLQAAYGIGKERAVAEGEWQSAWQSSWRKPARKATEIRFAHFRNAAKSDGRRRLRGSDARR